MHTMLYDTIHSHNYSLLLLPCKHTWAAKALSMLLQSGPSHSYAHSGLATIPSFTVGPVVDALTFYPQSLFWFG